MNDQREMICTIPFLRLCLSPQRSDFSSFETDDHVLLPSPPLFVCSFFPLLELQTEGAAQHDIDCNVVVCLSNPIKDHSCERPCWLYTFILTMLFQWPSKLIRNLLKLDFTWASYHHHMVRWPALMQIAFVFSTASVMIFCKAFLLKLYTVKIKYI